MGPQICLLIYLKADNDCALSAFLFYPASVQKPDWLWRTHFTTSTLALGEPLDKTALFAGLEQLLQEVFAFEKELQSRLLGDPQTRTGQ